ncbi:hypothetical protein ACIPY3_02935 [Paenarthrobacter sp. NPDC089714]|uniref:hypothetical protein n=1 Tax=Paenarthrobacter sp. NPDC089714 TaxID=3364377 RepID=UPI0037FF3CBB
MEAQFSGERTRVQEAEISERARVEVAQIALGDRLRGAIGHELVLVLRGGGRVAGVLGHVGKDWLLMSQGARQWLLPWWSVSFLEGLGRLVRKPSPGVGGSLGMAGALRGLARNRAGVAVHVASAGQAGRVFEGVIDRVGPDHLDVAVTRGEARRAGAVVSVVTVPFTALAAVCSLGGQDY